MYAPQRNADLATLTQMLDDQSARKHDLVAHSSSIHAVIAADNALCLYVDNAEPAGVDATGEIVSDPLFVQVSDRMASDIATRLDIPMRYWRKMSAEAPSLLVTNVNEWLERDERSHLLRTFRTDDGRAFGRAMLSERFECIDNFDVLLGVLDGVRATCPSARVTSADLTDAVMRLRITAPEISVNIADLVQHYTVNGRSGADFPLMHAGIVVQNSETGGSAFTISPYAVVEVCTNGMTRQVDALRRVHLGSRLEEGVINWSDETRRNQVQLIRSQARDAVAAFMNVDMLQRFVSDMSAAHNVQVTQPSRAVENVTSALTFSEIERDAILMHFASTGGSTALDLAQAITYVAGTIEDDERAAAAQDGALAVAMAAADA